MGCCLTTPTTTATAAAGDHHHANSKPTSKPHGGGPPPPPPPEEETVKEVLSETPITAIKPPPTKISGDGRQILRPVEESRPPNDVVPLTKNRIENDAVPLAKNKIEENASEVSSEMYYTYSESFSAATTTTTSFATDLKRNEIGNEEEGEVNQRVKKKKRPPEKMAPRKPPAPEKMATSVRRKERGIGAPARRSTVPSRNVTTEKCRRNVVQSDAGRRDPPARRRSRSPAVRSPVPKSGSREPVNTTENGGKFRLKKTTDGGVVPAPVPEPESEICESLENPLVSLECFIFL